MSENRVSPQYILLWSGAGLIIVGVLLTAIQFSIEANNGIPFGAVTHYVGVMVLAIGALLELLPFATTFIAPRRAMPMSAVWVKAGPQQPPHAELAY
jgi:hypothetical protein